MMRFHPAHQYIREQIAAGALGNIQFVHIERTTFADFKAPDFPAHRKWFVDRSKSGGGVFVDLGSHLLDLLLYLLDDEVEDCALSATPDFDLGVELSGLASLKFMKGTMATLFASWGINLHDNLLQVYGDQGCIQAMRTIGPYTDWSVELVQGDQRTAVKIPYQNHYIRELDHFVDCIQTGKEPLTSGANCLETERLRIQLMNSLHQ
jgi:predicted dehydrogenase